MAGADFEGYCPHCDRVAYHSTSCPVWLEEQRREDLRRMAVVVYLVAVFVLSAAGGIYALVMW